jgi:acetyltransferase-like isoleucine patch superfamily enzyme
MIGRVKRLLLRVKARRIFGRDVVVFGNFQVENPSKVKMGSNCAINEGVFLLGRSGITIGDDVVLSARCMIIDGGLQARGFASTAARSYKDAPIVIGNGAWIGAAAIILPGVIVGERSIVGAGSVVTKDIPPRTVFAGNPARQIGSIDAG